MIKQNHVLIQTQYNYLNHINNYEYMNTDNCDKYILSNHDQYKRYTDHVLLIKEMIMMILFMNMNTESVINIFLTHE